jgi:hypothetical protein
MIAQERGEKPLRIIRSPARVCNRAATERPLEML